MLMCVQMMVASCVKKSVKVRGIGKETVIFQLNTYRCYIHIHVFKGGVSFFVCVYLML